MIAISSTRSSNGGIGSEMEEFGTIVIWRIKFRLNQNYLAWMNKEYKHLYTSLEHLRGFSNKFVLPRVLNCFPMMETVLFFSTMFRIWTTVSSFRITQFLASSHFKVTLVIPLLITGLLACFCFKRVFPDAIVRFLIEFFSSSIILLTIWARMHSCLRSIAITDFMLFSKETDE